MESVDRSDPRTPGQRRSPGQWWKAGIGGRNREDWLETLTVLLLATASLATAWSGFQAAQWGSDQSKLYSEASSHRVEANEAATNAHLDAMGDLAAFNGYASAYVENHPDLMAFFEGQFSDRLQPAVAAWLATGPFDRDDEPNTPLDMPEYIVPSKIEAEQLRTEARALFAQGVDASRHSTAYVLNTLYLAAVLFFAGISNRLHRLSARVFLLGMGAVFLLYGLFHIITLPIQ